MASATQRSLHPDVHCINHKDLKKIIKEEVGRGYERHIHSCFEFTAAPTVMAVQVNVDIRQIQVLVWLPIVCGSG